MFLSGIKYYLQSISFRHKKPCTVTRQWIGTITALFAVASGYGQITYTAAFTRLLEKSGMEYAEPAEQWMHVTVPPVDGYMDYDLVVENDREDFEIRYCFHLEKRSKETPPSVEVARLVASIASNDPETEIRIQIPADSFLIQAFNADYGLIAHFIPKAEFSGKPIGVFISLYSENRPGIDIVLLYRDPAYDPLTMFRSIRFND